VFDTSAREIQFAVEAVRQAAKVAQMVQAVPALAKADRSPVTVADFAAQAVAGRLLDERLPGETLVAEEGAAVLRLPENKPILDEVACYVGRLVDDATPDRVCAWIDRGDGTPVGRFWVMDPVDGTKGFLRGGQYAVALALVEDGQVRLGVVACPNLGRDTLPNFEWHGTLLAGVRGQGAWAASLNGSGDFIGVRVSNVDVLGKACLMRSVESGHTNVGQVDAFVAALGTVVPPIRMDSQAKYAVIASGGADLLCRFLSPEQPDYREKIWDQAAGCVVLEEAGGRVTDLDGNALDFTRGRTLAGNRGVLASNGRLHEAALEILSGLGY